MSQYSKWVARQRSDWAAKEKKLGCATGILRPFVKGRRDWHCYPQQRKVGVEVKRCCNMKRGPRGRRGWREYDGSSVLGSGLENIDE